VPLGREILIPGAVVFGVGGTGRGGRTPDGRISGLQSAVSNDRDRPAQRIDADIAAPDIRQILGRHAGLQARHALQPGIGPESVQAQEQSRLQYRALEGFVGGRTFQRVGKVQPQVGFLKDADPLIQEIMARLLTIREVLLEQRRKMDALVLKTVRADEVCTRFMRIPGVGPIAA
jgi:hypothetical protein